MIITRWQAPLVPSKAQISASLMAEGLETFEEKYSPKEKVLEHRHPFSEVRIVLKGELLFNVQGNQFLLRPGDKVEVPPNTKHWHINQGAEPCICICAQRTA